LHIYRCRERSLLATVVEVARVDKEHAFGMSDDPRVHRERFEGRIFRCHSGTALTTAGVKRSTWGTVDTATTVTLRRELSAAPCRGERDAVRHIGDA